MKIRLILADDHPVMIAGVRHELESVQTLSVMGTAMNSNEVVSLLDAQACDVLITDYLMPGGGLGDGLSMLAYLRRRYPALKMIVYTSIDNPAVIAAVLRLGVSSVVHKAVGIGHLIAAIHAVHAGSGYQPLITEPMEPSPETRSGLDQLSRRELEVVRMFVGGLSVTDIARQLNRSKQTVSSQKASAMRKLGLCRDAELFSFSYESGLLSGGAAGSTVAP